MTPSHAKKKDKRYRYYVSRTLVIDKRAKSNQGRRVPAGSIEDLVKNRLYELVQDQAFIYETVSNQTDDPTVQNQMMADIQNLAYRWTSLPSQEHRKLLLSIIIRIEIHGNSVEIKIRPNALCHLNENEHAISSLDPNQTLTLNVAARLRRAGIEKKLVIDAPNDGQTKQEPDRSLIRLLAQADTYHQRVLKNRDQSLKEMAAAEKVSPSYFTRVLRLSYLAPDITRSILAGRQPVELSARKLKAASRLPLDWQEQKDHLGFC